MQKLLSLVLLALLCLEPAHACLPCLQQLLSPLKTSSISLSRFKAEPAPKPQLQAQPNPPQCYQPAPQPLPQPHIVTLLPSPIPQPKPSPIRQSNSFILSLEWACRQGISFGSCQGSIVWNNQVVHSIRPCDYGVHTVSITVNAVVHQNVLQLRGEGLSDSFGLTVDNVRLVKQGTSQNIVLNGDFEQPCTNGGWKFFNNIPGWQGENIEIGAGKIYNCRWNSQVCELDANKNNVLTQSFNFDCEYNLQRQGRRCGCGCGCN